MAHRCTIFDPQDRRIPKNFLGSNNMEVLPEGCCPSYDHAEMGGSSDKLHYFSTAIEAKNPSGNPRQYSFVNDDCYYFEAGALTLDKDFDDVVQGAVIFDDAVTPPNERLIAFFGNSTTGSLSSGGHAWRNLGTDTTPWTYHNAATAIQAWVAERAGHRAMLASGGNGQGRTFLGEHNTSMIIAGLYDGTTTNIGPAEPVGHSDWPLIRIAAYLGSFIAGKGTGPFHRNNIELAWQPMLQILEKLPHGLNCKVLDASENGVILSTDDGGLWKWDGRVLRDITPLRNAAKPKDAQRGRISFAADRGDKLAVGYAAWQPVIDGPTFARMGGRVFTRIAGTYAEITSGVTDGDFATPASANMNAWGGTSTDRLILISPVPLAGFCPYVTRNPNANANGFATPEYGTVSGGPPTFASWGTIVDHTILAAATASLKLIGFPPAAAEPIVAGDSKTAYWDAASVTFSFGGAIGDVTGYVYQVSPTNTTAMSTTTTIDEIGVVLARPGLKLNDASGPFTSANNFTSLAASGALTPIFFGDPQGGDYNWSVPYLIFTKGGDFVARWHAGTAGALSNGGQPFLLYGRTKQTMIAEGPTRNPRHTKYPRLCQWESTEPGPRLVLNSVQLREDNGNLADPSRAKRITLFEVEGDDISTADYMQFWVDCLDNRPPWKFGTAKGTAPIVIKNPAQQGDFYDCTVHYLFHDQNQTDLWAPLTRRIWCEWEYVDDLPKLTPPTVALA